MNEKVSNLVSDLYPMSLEEFAASETFYRLHRFEDCPLTFIYNTVTCKVSIYNGDDTDALIVEVNRKGVNFLHPELQYLVKEVFAEHQRY